MKQNENLTAHKFTKEKMKKEKNRFLRLAKLKARNLLDYSSTEFSGEL
jgi:hypothetical protein